MPIDAPPRITSRNICAKTKIFTVEALDLEFNNGTQCQYERLKGSARGAVLVVALQDDNTVVLIHEYAAGVERYELAFPKGKIDPGESILDAANRELKEEIGFGARRLEHITSYTVAPGYLGHTTHVVLAEDLYPERLVGDEPEPIEVVTWRLDDVAGLLAREDVTEARSIAALYLVRDLKLG
jgi:ADP-ribose diphosphatase